MKASIIIQKTVTSCRLVEVDIDKPDTRSLIVARQMAMDKSAKDFLETEPHEHEAIISVEFVDDNGEDHLEEVDLIAKGYEWECPFCHRPNEEFQVEKTTKCSNCKTVFAIGGYNHAEA